MGQLIAGFATSHALTLESPDMWDLRRGQNRGHYHKRFGQEAPQHAGVDRETLAGNLERYARIAAAHESIRQWIARERPDAIVLIADDQNENLTRANLPQVAVYTGGDFQISREGARARALPAFARELLDRAVEQEIDMAELNRFEDDFLRAHAFGPVLQKLDPAGVVPVVPVFVNAIHVPAPSPARCLRIGEVIGEAVRLSSNVGRVVLLGSGGLSHFTAGYPWEHYHGTHQYGSIDEPFDRWLLGRLQAADVESLRGLSSRQLLDAGEIELRAWLTVLGAVGAVAPTTLVYEPFYRGIMAMAVAHWPVRAAASRADA